MMRNNTLLVAQTWLVVYLYLLFDVTKASPESGLVCEDKDISRARKAGLQLCESRGKESSERCQGVQRGDTRDTCSLLTTRCYKYRQGSFIVVGFLKRECASLHFSSTDGLGGSINKASNIKRTSLRPVTTHSTPAPTPSTTEKPSMCCKGYTYVKKERMCTEKEHGSFGGFKSKCENDGGEMHYLAPNGRMVGICKMKPLAECRN